MEQSETVAARLLPKTQWTQCLHCEGYVPEFEFSEQFQSTLTDLMTKGERFRIMLELERLSGCESITAKMWVMHKTYRHPDFDPKEWACPYCGKRMRSPQAKQCRFCGRDWH